LNFNNLIKGYREKIDERLSSLLKEQSKKEMPGLYEPMLYVMSGGGKRIRPLLLMLVCESVGGNPMQSLDAGVAVEILHNFTLVHDDIMDNAETRRGKETIHKKWNVNNAILVGDELIALSYKSLLRTESTQIKEIAEAFTEGVIEVCEGQALDKDFETSEDVTIEDVTIEDYITMIRKKTAELLKASAFIGALIADSSDEVIESLKNYSLNIGLAFQINDDLLDVIADESEFGKKIGGDILEKKKTFLYLKALEFLKGQERENFVSLYSSDDENKIENVISAYKNSCVIESTKSEIKKFTDIANESLDKINLQNKNLLYSFSEMLMQRNY